MGWIDKATDRRAWGEDGTKLDGACSWCVQRGACVGTCPKRRCWVGRARLMKLNDGKASRRRKDLSNTLCTIVERSQVGCRSERCVRLVAAAVARCYAMVRGF